MKRLFAGVLCALLLAAARADEAVSAPAAVRLEVLPKRAGYAFDQPHILVRQRLFGLAHGVSLLAAACLDLPEYSLSIQDAYAEWHAKQRAAIETIVLDLAHYYFGPRADEAEWPDLSRALNLADTIQPALSNVTLHAACASLPAAIGRPRYALDKLLADTVEPESADAVLPAPTFKAIAE